MDLVEFLRARLDEDEQSARIANAAGRVIGWKYDGNGAVDYGDHGALSTPDRVLVEVEAKRRIIGAWGEGDGPLILDHWMEHQREGLTAPDHVHNALIVLKALASVYADHPDYNPDWRA